MDIRRSVIGTLREAADPARALQQHAHMKSEMPSGTFHRHGRRGELESDERRHLYAEQPPLPLPPGGARPSVHQR